MARIVRIRRTIERVVVLEKRQMVVRIGPAGISLRVLGAGRDSAVPVTWAELIRDGGCLDHAELKQRPLLEKWHHLQDAGG